ncbi:MAG: condensation domain-containing protein, partial [Acidobacteriota bacterium]
CNTGNGNLIDLDRILPVARDQEIPLSFSQQRLWFIDKLTPDSPAYNIPTAVRLRGTVNIEVLLQSINEVVCRHETLRTTFIDIDGQPVQKIANELILSLPIIDLEQLPVDEQESKAIQLTIDEARSPFNIAKGPLLRVSLLRLSPQDHILLMTMHHIVSDGWSMGLLITEIRSLYECFLSELPANLPALSIQYADFAYWQRKYLQGEVLERQISYWKQQLDALPVLQLPTDHPRPAIQSFRGAMQPLFISKETLDVLNALSNQHGTTLFMVLLSAFLTLLHRYTGQNDIAVGSPIAGRNRAEIENLIGFFVNTLVLRVGVAGNLSFTELLARVRQVALEAYAHQDLPFDKLVEELQPKRSLSHMPLFQVLFVLQNAPMPSLELPELTLSPFIVDNAVAKFDLTLSLMETAEGLTGSFDFSTDLFEQSTITRMVSHFQTLLAGIATEPEQCLSHLPLLTMAEQHQLLVEWNDTKKAYPQDQNVVKVFEAKVVHSPQAIALIFEDEQLSYQELNQRANRLAHYLQTSGVTTDNLVGLFVERSVDMVVGLLGTLKVGAAYVPLDPSYPKDRLTWLLEDMHTNVLLTQQQLLDKLPTCQARVVCLDTDWQLINKESVENLAIDIAPENLAYVLYTSGSTGRSKGVLIEHRQLLNYVSAATERLGFKAEASYAWVQPFTFDSCNTVIYGALLNGGCLHLISRERASDAQKLSEYFRRYKIDYLKITPSHLAALQNAADLPAQLLPHKRLVLGGETSHWNYLQELKSLGSNCVIFNHYGPTETTVGVTIYPTENGSIDSAATVPIGRPIHNTQLYILDKYFQ